MRRETNYAVTLWQSSKCGQLWLCVYLYNLQTLRTEGPLALYKGFFPSYLRLGPWNIIVSYTHIEWSDRLCMSTARHLASPPPNENLGVRSALANIRTKIVDSMTTLVLLFRLDSYIIVWHCRVFPWHCPPVFHHVRETESHILNCTISTPYKSVTTVAVSCLLTSAL